MQTLGTEWGRHIIAPDLWVSLAAMRLDDHIHSPGVVFSDVRFENEANFIRQRGTLLHIARPDLTPIDQHESENGVAMHHRDQLVMNFSLAELYKQADGWVNELELRAVA